MSQKRSPECHPEEPSEKKQATGGDDFQAEMMKAYTEVTELNSRLKELKKKGGKGKVTNYTFKSKEGDVSLSDAFGDKSDLIVIQNMGPSCTYCTMWADGLNGLLPHLQSRASVVLINNETPSDQEKVKTERHWNFTTLSSAGTSFKEDLGFGNAEHQMPGYSTFHKEEDGSIVNVANDFFGPGDSYCAVWPMFDLLKDGPGEWQPKESY